MRNWVAKNDFNRSSVHTDRKKDLAPEVEDGLSEWETDKFYQENKEEVDSLLDSLRGASSPVTTEAIHILELTDGVNT